VVSDHEQTLGSRKWQFMAAVSTTDPTDPTDPADPLDLTDPADLADPVISFNSNTTVTPIQELTRDLNVTTVHGNSTLVLFMFCLWLGRFTHALGPYLYLTSNRSVYVCCVCVCLFVYVCAIVCIVMCMCMCVLYKANCYAITL
jgi:hypothetical protein